MFEQEHAARDVLPLTHHVQVQPADEARKALLVSRKVGHCSGHFGHPEEAHGALQRGQSPLPHQFGQHAGGLQVGGHAAGVVVGEGRGVAKVADDQHFLGRLSRNGGGDDLQRAVVEAGAHAPAHAGRVALAAPGLLAQFGQPLARARADGEGGRAGHVRVPVPEGSVRHRVPRLPPEGRHFAHAVVDVGHGTARGGLAHHVGQFGPGEHHLAGHVHALVVFWARAVGHVNQLGLPLPAHAAGHQGEAHGFPVGQAAVFGADQVQPALLGPPALERGPVPEGQALPRREFMPLDVQAPGAQPLGHLLGRSPVVGAGLNAVEGGEECQVAQGALAGDTGLHGL